MKRKKDVVVEPDFPTGEIYPEALQQMRDRGGTWAAYENSELGHPNAGHLQFLKVGEGCTYKEAPPRMPDTQTVNWRYLYVGTVDLETGKVSRKEK